MAYTYWVGCPNGYATNYDEINGAYLKDGDMINVYNTYYTESLSDGTTKERYKTTSFTLPAGRYKIKMFGGAGTFSKGKLNISHMPGYSEGILTIYESTKFTAAVGQSGGEDNTIYPSFPDGDDSYGGGGSYIAIRDGDPIYSKIIVAGGSGGFFRYDNTNYTGTYSSYGGGVNGYRGGNSKNPDKDGLFGKRAVHYTRWVGTEGYPFSYFGGGGFAPGCPSESNNYPAGGSGYVWTPDTASWYPKDSGSSLLVADYLESAFTFTPYEYEEKYGSGTYDITRTNGSISITVLETHQRRNSNIYKNPEDIVTDLSKLGTGGITINNVDNGAEIENYTDKEITDMINALWK